MKRILIPALFAISLILCAFTFMASTSARIRDGDVEVFTKSVSMSESDVYKTNPSLINGVNNSFNKKYKIVRTYKVRFMKVYIQDDSTTDRLIYYRSIKE